ncbi:MAG: ATP-dependent Clp protease proteolytic subunit, partial [Flavobacteriaceae bacterium]|nr:ATP-dependent Clp protease proteolytic subunit [Flavobacteriaceae bacterium]
MIFEHNENTITAYGTIWNDDGMPFVSMLKRLEKQYDDITLRLHTDGGSVFAGNLMYNAIKSSQANIRIEIIGIAASMGAVIALSSENVALAENGFIMIHAPSGYVYGNATDLENNARLLRSIEGNFISKLAERTGQSTTKVQQWLVGDNWFSAQEALDQGLISSIIEPDTEVEHFEPEQLKSKEAFYRIAAQLTTKNSNLHTMKKPLIESLNLEGVTEQSSDTAVIQAVQSQIAALRSAVDQEKQARLTLEKNADAQLEAVVEPLLDQAIKQGKITAEQKPTYKTIAKASGIEALNTVLGNISQRSPIVADMAVGKTSTTSGREGWDFDKWQKED